MILRGWHHRLTDVLLAGATRIRVIHLKYVHKASMTSPCTLHMHRDEKMLYGKHIVKITAIPN